MRGNGKEKCVIEKKRKGSGRKEYPGDIIKKTFFCLASH